jgi:hypothetical protein
MSKRLVRFGEYEVTIKVREQFKGRDAKPEVVALNGKKFIGEILWMQDEGDPYPGEWAIATNRNENGFESGFPIWISSGDLIIGDRVK